MTKQSSSSRNLHKTLGWPSGYTAWLPERITPIRRVGYTLVDLMRRGLVPAKTVEAFQQETLLKDVAWRVLWADTDSKPDAESVAIALRSAEGIVIFIHGWAGSSEIWEDLPAMVIQRNPRLVALVPDVNGFGGTPFSTDLPPINKCNPPAIMRAIDLWIDALGLRAKRGDTRRRPVIFVGHSMGGATLFFLDTKRWKKDEAGRIALAPALLLNDRQRQVFYQTVGTGIHLTRLSDILDWLVEKFIAPRFIQTVAGSGSMKVRALHKRVFDTTPEGVIAQTFAAMGQLHAHFDQPSWPNFVTFLAEKDLLVGLKPTTELLESMHFQPAQIRVAPGDHYFFSVGGRADPEHIQSRQRVIDEIVSMQKGLLALLNKKPVKKSRASKQK